MAPSRFAKTRPRKSAQRSAASTRWLERQLNDPYVHDARRLGFRARSVFKLKEIDERHHLLKRGARVLDLGAAPGSWSQYAAQRGCRVTAIDILAMDPISGVTILQGDFLEQAMQDRLRDILGGTADTVLSDIAADTTGRRSVDRLRAEAISETALGFAAEVLVPGGACLVKLLKGAEARLVPLAVQHFQGYRLIKPVATRKNPPSCFFLRRVGALPTEHR